MIGQDLPYREPTFGERRANSHAPLRIWQRVLSVAELRLHSTLFLRPANVLRVPRVLPFGFGASKLSSSA